MDQRTFQISVYVFFGVLFLGGFLSLSLYGYFKKVEQEKVDIAAALPRITIWGTIDAASIRPIVRQISSQKSPDKRYSALSYVEKDPRTVHDEYTKATALGRAPDLLLLDHATLLALSNTLRTIPFSYFPYAQYERTFLPVAKQFVTRAGYLGFPFLADTMVLYYNENLRRRAGIRDLPVVWSDFTEGEMAAVIEEYRETDRSVIPLGAYDNYRHAVDLLSALLLQARESSDDGLTRKTAEKALEFYTSFANPRASVYGWSRSLPDARDMFIADDLLFYPGFVSEYQEIVRANPNIVIRVAPLPQIADDVPSWRTLRERSVRPVDRDDTSPATQLSVAERITEITGEITEEIIEEITAEEITKEIAAKIAAKIANSTAAVPAVIYAFGIPSSSPFLASLDAAFDLLGIFQNEDNDFLDILPIPPAVQGYYPDETSTAAEIVLINSLFAARAVPLLPGQRRQVADVIRGVVVGSRSVSGGVETLLSPYQ